MFLGIPHDSGHVPLYPGQLLHPVCDACLLWMELVSVMPMDVRVQNSAMAIAAQIIWGLHEAAAVIFGQLRGSRKEFQHGDLLSLQGLNLIPCPTFSVFLIHPLGP